jgi:hypothetical protein
MLAWRLFCKQVVPMLKACEEKMAAEVQKRL